MLNKCEVFKNLKDFAASTRRAKYYSCFASTIFNLDGLTLSIKKKIYEKFGPSNMKMLVPKAKVAAD